jgi:hypothetical protein
MLLRNSFVPFMCLLVFFSFTLAQTPRKSRGWEPTKALLASPDRFVRKAARELKLDSGEYLVLSVSTQCNDCDRVAAALNKRPDLDRIVGVTKHPDFAVKAWVAKLGLKFRVLTVSEEIFSDMGGLLLPTVIFLRDGQPLAAREDAPRDEKDVPNLPPAPPAKAPATRRN